MSEQPNKTPRVYTRSGDGGMTSLSSGRRVRKTEAHIVACGDLDELNSFIGLLACEAEGSERAALRDIQRRLLDAGGCVAGFFPAWERFNGSETGELEARIDRLQAAADRREGRLVLPGGCRCAALSHVCRSVCRRAERSVCAAEEGEEFSPLRSFLNRLSDYFFVLALFFNHFHDLKEIKWEKDTRS